MSKKILAGVGIAAALGVAVLPAVGTFAVGSTTVIRATVEEFVGCTSDAQAESTVALGNISAGTAKSGTFVLNGTTNSPSGFTIYTENNIGSLVLADQSDSIAYSASAVEAGTEGWYLSVADNTGATIGNTVSLNSAATGIANPRNNSWTFTATVSTSTETTVGAYSGEIAWTCIVNH